MVLNKLDFEFATSPDDVGMQTGATIHTQNGLNMIVKKHIPSEGDEINDDGWWEKQHLKRGLNVDGRPFDTKEDAVWSKFNGNEKKTPLNGSGGCPVSH